MAMWIATWESRNFSFMAIGKTVAAARAALVEGLIEHGEQYDCQPEWWECPGGWENEVNVVRVSAGDCLRDGSLLRAAAA